MKSVVDVDLNVLADVFSNMTDDEQAQFFIEVAKRFKSWGPGWTSQAQYIGAHLKNCSCSTDEARELIENIAYAMEHSTHGQEAA